MHPRRSVFVSSPRAEAEPGYGGHWFATRCSSQIDHDCQCGICDGALGFCVICREGEAGLARICPGEFVSKEEHAARFFGMKLTMRTISV